MVLPEPRKPFPIKYPYRVRSDMYKLGQPLWGYEEDSLFIIDSDYEVITAESLKILKNYPQHGRVYLDDDLDGLRECLWDIAECIAKDMPQYFNFESACFSSHLTGLSLKRGGAIQFDARSAIFPDIGKACYEHLQELTPFDQLCDLLRLSVEEDLVIGKVNLEEASDAMECMLVTLPSKWDPLNKIGLDFARVHAPIPDSDRLLASAPRLIQAIMTKGDFVRYNWTISNGSWSRNPSIEGDYHLNDRQLDASIDDLETMLQKVYFRSERQTLRAFPQYNRYFFAIHTYLHPLSEMLTSPERQQEFLDILLTIPREIREHRGMVNTVIEQLAYALARN